MYRMMIVDDEERIVNSIYDLMEENFDFELYRCYSGVQALALLKRMRFDIIISDVSMPQMSGLDLLEAAKALWPKCHFLILTAYNNFDYAYRAMKYDRVDYLLKVESYDEICRIIEKKRARIEQERQEELQLQHYDHRLHHLSENMCRYFLKRIIVQGIPLPEQSDLCAINLSIRLDQPVLLALAITDVQGAVEQSKAGASIDDTVNAQLAQYQMASFTYVSNSNIVFALQSTAKEPRQPDELVIYAQTVFENLPQIAEEQAGHKLAILCSDHFVPWVEAHALYQRAAIALESLRNESGMMIFSVESEMRQTMSEIGFPNMDEAYLLWEMIKCGNLQGFNELMQKGMAELRQVQNLQALLPHTSISAVGFLLLETAKMYAPHYAEQPKFKALVSCFGYERGQAWLDDVMDAMSSILQARDTSQQKNGTWLVERINQYIEQHYAEDITLTTLADIMHYSPSYLSRFYKLNTGVNLMSHVYDVRIANAKSLLTKTNLKIPEIAANTGFCSSKYFNRIFKKAVGISAMQFREQRGKISDSPFPEHK